MRHKIWDGGSISLSDSMIISDFVEAAIYPNEERVRVSLYTGGTCQMNIQLWVSTDFIPSYTAILYLVQTIQLQNFRLTHDFHQPSSSG